VKRFPHSAALCEQEGVHHPAADDEEIHLFGEVAEHVDLRRNLEPANDCGGRTLRRTSLANLIAKPF
jgi:hypothetical protein